MTQVNKRPSRMAESLSTTPIFDSILRLRQSFLRRYDVGLLLRKAFHDLSGSVIFTDRNRGATIPIGTSQ